MLHQYIIIMLLAMMPIFEARYAILSGLLIGLNPYAIFIIAVIANIAIIPFVIFALRQANFKKFMAKIMGKRIQKTIEKYSKHFEKYEELALLLFVAIPLPFTGAWTAMLVSETLNMKWKKAWKAISVGIIFSSILMILGVNSIEIILQKLF